MMLIFAVQDTAAEAEIERLLGVRFVPHDSFYLGDYWLAELPDSGLFLRIRWNQDPLWLPGDPDEERFAFPEHSQHEWILEVGNATTEVRDLLCAILSLQLLEEE